MEMMEKNGKKWKKMEKIEKNKFFIKKFIFKNYVKYIYNIEYY